MGTYPPFGTGLAQGVELVKHRRYPYLDSKSAIWTEGLAKNQIKLNAVTILPLEPDPSARTDRGSGRG